MGMCRLSILPASAACTAAIAAALAGLPNRQQIPLELLERRHSAPRCRARRRAPVRERRGRRCGRSRWQQPAMGSSAGSSRRAGARATSPASPMAAPHRLRVWSRGRAPVRQGGGERRGAGVAHMHMHMHMSCMLSGERDWQIYFLAPRCVIFSTMPCLQPCNIPAHLHG